MKPIRWGIVGPGIIANKFAHAIKHVACAELVAVASRSPERGHAFATRYQIPQVFDSYEALANSDQIDAIYIATPHPFHVSCAELFLTAGKHVLCEKPLCVNAEQARRLQEKAKEHRVFLMEAMWTAFLPAVLETQRLVKRGTIGDVLCIRADFCYAEEAENDPKLYQNHMAGGSLLDVGVYGLHFVSMFLDAPQQIQAVAQIQDGVDVHTSVQLQYPNGAIATVSSAIGLQKPEEAWIYGTNGRIELPHFYGAQELILHRGETSEQIACPSVGDGFEEEILEACRCIADGKTESDILPLSKSIAILEQMDHIRSKLGISYPCE